MESSQDKTLDFGQGDIGFLFYSMLWPTLVGMISMVVLNLTDGAFVGHGAGSDSLAAINIVGPCFLLQSGIALMFGMGASVVASIYLSKGHQFMANLNITLAFIAAEVLSLTLSVLLLCFPEESCRLFGSNDQLLPLATKYLFWIALFEPLGLLASVGMFIIRLDGNPRLAMWIMTWAAIANMFFDWLLIFLFKMGIEGAAIATGGTFAVGGVFSIIYIACCLRTMKLQLLYPNLKNVIRCIRYTFNIIKIGNSAFWGEAAIALVMILGNYMMIQYVGEDGVAAFSIACYCFPIVFSVGNAIVVSSQPIISFAYGVGNSQRIRKAFIMAMKAAIALGVFGGLLMSVGTRWVVGLFLESSTNAYSVAMTGLPIFGIGYIFISVNLILVGYLQSIEKATEAIVITMLRGYILIVATFLIFPHIFGVKGIWISMPAAECITMVIAAGMIFFGYSRNRPQ